MSVFKDRFNIILAVVILALLAVIILLAFLLQSSSLRFKSFEIQGGVEAAVLSDNQIIINFSRPLEAEAFQKEWIEFSPEVEFNYIVQGSRLNIFPAERFEADTGYNLEISEQITDIYETNLTESLAFDFTTKPNEFIFLENATEKETLWRGSVGNPKRELLVTGEDIDWFDINNRILVYSNFDLDQLRSVIKLIPINGEDFEPIEIVLDGEEVNKIEVSPDFNEFMFISQKVSSFDQNGQTIALPEDINRLMRYTLDEREAVEVEFPGLENGVSDVEYSRDGAILFVRNANSDYFRVNVADYTNFEVLGKINRVGNTNPDGDELAVMNFITGARSPAGANSVVEILTLAGRSTRVISDEERISKEPRFFNTSDSILYNEEQKRFGNNNVLFSVVLAVPDESGEYLEEREIALDDLSLEVPSISFDDRYLALERYSRNDITDFDNTRFFLTHSQPGTGDIIILDLGAQKSDEPLVVLEDSVDLRWIE